MASLKDTNILGKLVVTDKIIKSGGTSNDILLANGDTITKSALSGQITNNTTYSFTGGTNCFYVTPSDGSQQTITVTPSITNNITGSGTSGYLTKFNGANTITNGPALGTDTTKFLRNDGSWAVPPGSAPDLSGYVTGTGLTSNTIMLGDGNSKIKTSSKTIATSVGTDDTTIPTSKAVKDYITGLGYITGSYLPLAGGTMTGAIALVENKMSLKFRTHANYETGLVYGTTGNEALTLAMQNPVTAFQIVYGTKPSAYAGGTWQTVTPLFQTKDGKVIINRKITATADTSDLRLLDVNGDIGANDIFAHDITCDKITFVQESSPSIYSSSNIEGVYLDHGVETPQVHTSVILAPTTSGGSTYGVGSNGQVLKSNGTTVYWGTDNSGGSTFTLPTRLAANSSTSVTANGALEQGWYYINDGTTNRPPFKQVDSATGNDYRIMTTSYGSTWLQQIATDFRSNDIFIRRNQSGTWQPWTAVVRTLPCSVSGTTHSMPSITDNAIVRWATDRTATIQNSGVRIDDNNNIDGVNSLTLETSPANGISVLTAHADGYLMVNGEKLATQSWVQNYAIEDKIISATIVSQAQLFNESSMPTGTWVDGYWNTGTTVGRWTPQSATTGTSTLATVTTTNQTVNLRAPYSNLTTRERWVLRIQSQGISSISLSGAQFSQIGQNEYKIYFDNKGDGRVITITKGAATFKITVNFNTNNWID